MPSHSDATPSSVLGLIGNTPMTRLTRFDTGPCELFLKLESQNPGGSIKDRIALAMVEAAERDGRLQPGGTLVEATAGNTGLALALVAVQKGYQLKLVIPDKMSQEKIFHLKALGADVIMTRSDVEQGHPDYYQEKARALADATPGAAGQLLKAEGVLCGSSSGTLLAAALKYCREQTAPKRVVTFVCDSGNKYLSKIFNPHWLDDHGLTDRAVTHDLRDLIARPFLRGDVVWAGPQETLQQVYAKIRLFEISQVPVMESGRLIGLLDETDILTTVIGNPAAFNWAVGAIMRHEVETIEVNSLVTDLIPVFERCRAACVVDKGQFLGLITPIDFLNFLRKRTGQP